MRKLILIILLVISVGARAQITGSFTVGGDFDKFYPVQWKDGGWDNRVASQLEIGRPSVHENSQWRGSVMAKFTFHTTRWGNGAQFIDADIMQVHNAINGQDLDFIAGWKDATANSSSTDLIIWLRGGGTTYYYKSLYPTTCNVYDDVLNPLPFQEVGGAALTFKTAKDSYVNSNGLTKSGTAKFLGGGTNYILGNVGIGTQDTKGYRLAVAGSMIAESVKVQLQSAWPDYVFEKDYQLPSLEQTEKHIKEKGHLPGIPSAAEVKAEGIEVGEMNAKLLKKIEELTLYLIELKKEVKELKTDNQKLKGLILREEGGL